MLVRLSIALCSLTLLACATSSATQNETPPKGGDHPAHAEKRDPSPVEALKAHGQAIWREWESLRSAGLLSNELVFLAPPMRPEGTNSAFSEQIVDWLRESAPRGATVVYGSSLRSLLNSWYYGESLLIDSASALDLARRMQAGLVISGAVRERTDERHRKSIEVRIQAQRTDELALDFDSGLVRFDREHCLPEFLEAQSRHAQPPTIPFGGSREARSIAWDESKREELLRRALNEALTTLLARCRAAKEQGEVGVGPGDRKLLVLPVLDQLGELNALSDSLWAALSAVFTGQTPLKSALKRAEESNVALAWVFEPEIAPSVLEKLDLAGVVQPRFVYNSLLGQLFVEANVVDASGRSAPIEPVVIFTQDFAGVLEGALAQESKVTLPEPKLDGETLLCDALEGLMRQVLAGQDALRGRRLRLMPFESEATKEVGALFAQVWNEMIAEKGRILEQAAKLGVDADQALRKGGGELRVTLAVLGGQSFESYELARRTLNYWSWANVERASAFELGRAINESLVGVAAELGFTVQLTDETFPPLERSTLDARSPDPRITSFNLEEPEFVVQFRVAKLGDSLELRATLLDTTAMSPSAPSTRLGGGPKTIVALRRVQSRLRGDVADAINSKVLRKVTPVEPERLLFAVPKGLASPTDADPIPQALATARIELRASGARGEELARELAAALNERRPSSKCAVEATAPTGDAEPARRDASKTRLRIIAGKGAEAAAMELEALMENSNALPNQLRSRLRALSPSVVAAQEGATPKDGVVLVVIDG